MSSMVRDKLSRDTKSSDNLIENEMCACLIVSFDSGNSLFPFHEVISNHYYMMMPLGRSWVAIYKINPLLGEGTHGDCLVTQMSYFHPILLDYSSNSSLFITPLTIRYTIFINKYGLPCYFPIYLFLSILREFIIKY